MSNLSNYLTEAENAPITYPDLYKPKEVWKIREDNSSYYGRPDNGYLSASFVLEKNLKWPDLGFNLTVQVMNGGRTLIFLTEEDAKTFLKLAEANYPQLSNYNLIVAHGRGGEELVRINNSKVNVPIYISKNVLTWLSTNFEDTKVPKELQDRLQGEVQVSNDQKEKEEREQRDKEQKQNFNETIIKAINVIDSTCELYQQYSSICIKFKKENAIIKVEPRGDSKFGLSDVIFSDIDFGDHIQKDELERTLMPDKEVRDKLGWYNSCSIIDKKGQKIFYPRLSLRRTWDVDRVVKEINNYLDTIISIVNGYNNLEDFI